MERKEKILKRKSTKIIFFILMLIILAIGTASGVFFYMKSQNKNDFSKSATAYYAVFEDGTYYIPKAEPDVKFAIEGDDINSYKLTNSNNEVVESSVIEYKDKKYVQSKEQYAKGETYQLELENTNFTDEALKDTKKVQFKIKEDQKAEYKVSDKAIMVDNNNIQLQDNKLKIPNATLQEGQVIVVKDGNNLKDAYKITKLEGDTAVVDKPEVSEIYDSVDLYKEGKVDFRDFKINENAEMEVQKSVESSALYKFLANEVYASAEVPKVTFKLGKEGIEIGVELKFKADGEKKLGLESLKQHDLVIKLSYKISTNYLADVQKDFSMNFDMALKTTSNIEIEITSGNPYLKGISNISDEEYSKSVQEIVQKLEKEVPDVSENSIDIGAVEIPTGIWGVNVYFDIYLQTQLSLQINLKYQGQIESIQHTGFVMNKNEKKAYQNSNQTTSSHEFSVVGKAEIRVGVGVDAGISLINKDIAHAEIGVELGAYNEYFATSNFKYITQTKDIDSGIYAKIELGIYVKTKLNCSVDAWLFKAQYSADLKEAKRPIVKIETKVNWTDDNDTGQETISNAQLSNSNNRTTNQKSTQANSSSIGSTGTENGVVGSLSIDTDSDAVRAYKKYIKDKKYIEDYKQYLEGEETASTKLRNVGYCIFDINQDGIPELIIDSITGGYDDAWKTDAIYTYRPSSKLVVKVKLIYNYGGIRYEKNEKEITCSTIRPNYVTGVYEFYKLKNEKLVGSKTVGHDRGYYDVKNGTYQYDNHMLWDSNGKTTMITEEQERAYFNNVIDFSYQDITKIK